MTDTDPADDELWKQFAKALDLVAGQTTDPQAKADTHKKFLEQLLPRFGIDASNIPNDLLVLRVVLGRETDRGVALMAAAYLDSQLESLLTKYFVDDARVSADLLSGSGGLSTFSARIDMAYLLALVSPLGRRDLHLIRKIRNEFAHNATLIAFEDEGISARCRELHHDVWKDDLPPRKKFIRVAMGAAGLIQGAIKSLVHKQPASEIPFETRLSDDKKAALRAALENLDDESSK